jgi:hypothetical protein
MRPRCPGWLSYQDARGRVPVNRVPKYLAVNGQARVLRVIELLVENDEQS